MTHTLHVERNLEIPMCDGVILQGDLYLPQGNGPWPTLLERTPYGKGFSETSFALFAAEQGYAVLLQDTRGRWASQGESYPFRPEKIDGYDTLEWIAQQPWSNGKVGMFGGSYVGYTQLAAACQGHPALKAIIPAVAFQDPASILYRGGALALGVSLSWNLLAGAHMAIFREPIPEAQKAPLWEQLVALVNGLSAGETFRQAPLKKLPLVGEDGLVPFLMEAIGHPAGDAYWEPFICPLEAIQVPALHVGGWYDLFIQDTLLAFNTLSAQGIAQKLWVGPWVHGSFDGLVGEVDFGLQASAMMLLPEEVQLRWFDHWLKGRDTGLLEEPPISLFTMGRNTWRQAALWPLEGTRYISYYLHSAGGANSLRGDGSLSPELPGDEPVDSFLYDSRNPVPTRGGGLCCWNPALAPGAYDQRPVEERPDVLVYTSAPLQQDLEVTGPLQVRLYATSSATCTDFTAKLVDLGPCGYARNVQDGILRVNGKPIGEAWQLEIDLAATSNLFKAGHSIRLEISSSNFPRFDRNPNTGRSLVDTCETQTALQTVFHDARYPSQIILPVIPA